MNFDFRLLLYLHSKNGKFKFDDSVLLCLLGSNENKLEENYHVPFYEMCVMQYIFLCHKAAIIFLILLSSYKCDVLRKFHSNYKVLRL